MGMYVRSNCGYWMVCITPASVERWRPCLWGRTCGGIHTHTHTSMQPISRLPSHTHHLNRPTPPTHPQPFAAYAPLTTCPVAGPISPVAAALPTLDATAFLPVVVITPTPVSVAPVGPTGVWRKLGSPRGHVQCP